MLKNYLKVALRQLLRQRLYTFINVFGLTLGIACCLIIYLYLSHENSYDQFRPKMEHLYQVYDIDYLEGAGEAPTAELLAQATPGLSAYLPVPVGATMEEEFPEVVAHSVFSKSDGIFQVGPQSFQQGVHLVAPDFFDMLDLEILAGEKEALLTRKDQILQPDKHARKFFADEDPIGQRLSMRFGQLEQEVQVQAIVADQPTHTNFPFEALTFEETRLWYDRNQSNWNSYNTPVIVQLAPGVAPETIEAKLLDLIERKKEKSFKRIREEFELPDTVALATFGLTPLRELHTTLGRDWPNAIDRTYTYILAGIAMLILLIACINYITLSLAQLSGRLREVGVRKVLGAHRRHVVLQFWGEAQVLALLAMVLSLGLAELSLPLLRHLSGRDIAISYEMHGQAFWVLLAITVLVGVVAGGYPAWYVSRYQPVKILKGGRHQRTKGRFSQALAVFQYSLTLFLITSSLVMFRQMNYISQMDLGFDQNQMVVIPTQTGWSSGGEELLQKMRTSLAGRPEIIHLTGVSSAFSRGWSRYGFDMESEELTSYVYRVEPAFVSAMGLNLLQGRDFSTEMATDTNSVLINAQMARLLKNKLGWEDPLGHNLPFFGEETNFNIIGVVADFHFRSLSHTVEPALLHMHAPAGKINYLYLKINPAQQTEALAAIETAWRQHAPQTPLDYSFLDEDLADQYEDYRRRMRIMGIATALAICIACLGLFGMASLTTVSRTKEIGIRKVLGANVRELLVLLNREVLMMALLAFVIAAPLANWAMSAWLESFAYQIYPDAGLFLICLLIAIVLAISTVSYQVLRTARTSPVNALRYE